MELISNKLFLENVRDNPIGSIHFQLFKTNNSFPYYVRSAYMDYARKAFNDMVRGLKNLENATNSAALCSIDHVNCASLWFLSIESFISDILEILYYFNPLQCTTANNHEKITAKLQKIIRAAKFPKKQCRRTGFFSRIEEFANIRNSIFHGAYPHEKAETKNTLFYADMMQWNIIDCLQAYKIAMETFHLFDLIIPQYRLMPQIPFTMRGAASWIMLDDLHKEYFVPYFNAVLEKHNLNTNFDATIFDYQFIDSTAIPSGGVRAMIYAAPSLAFDLSKDNTALNEQYLQPLMKYLPTADMIKLPNMIRDSL